MDTFDLWRDWDFPADGPRVILVILPPFAFVLCTVDK